MNVTTWERFIHRMYEEYGDIGSRDLRRDYRAAHDYHLRNGGLFADQFAQDFKDLAFSLYGGFWSNNHRRMSGLGPKSFRGVRR